MTIPKDLTGRRFGLLTAEVRASSRKGRAYWKCRCDCGNSAVVATCHLASGHTKSCGCLIPKIASAKAKTHGLRDIVEYGVWARMRQRCENPRNRDFKDYGARGIFVCERWNLFENFIEDMGRKPSAEMQIDRIDNDGPYSPENCRWATPKQQANNRRIYNGLELNGRTYSRSEIGRMIGLSPSGVCKRIKAGMSIDEIMRKKRDETKVTR